MKAAVIFGAGGIAAATGEQLSRRGFGEVHVMTRGRSTAGDTMRKRLDDLGVGGRTWTCDVTDWDSITSACTNVAGPIHALIYTAGSRFTMTPSGLTQDEWRRMIDTYAGGLVGALIALEDKLAVGASVVAMSGTSARRVVSGEHLAMGSAKAAMDRSVAYLAHWLAPKGVRVNGVCCGPVDTPTVREMLTPDELELLAESMAKKTLAGRMAQADDIAGVVALLCSDESRWIYGQVILADGGEELLRG
jgi:NAD(P)-dependent dehydrogenase (short-subunit alcohol dehydrogenase family)